MLRTRQALQWSALALALLGITGALMFFLGGAALYGYVELVTAVGLVLFALALIFLWLSYRRRPEVREKTKLAGQLKQAQQELDAAQAQLAEALHKTATIRDEAQEKRDRRQRQFREHVDAIEREIGNLEAGREEELAAELARLQQEHIDAGLRAEPLEPAHVPGIGAALVEKLNAGGVQTAYDVNRQVIDSIPGFGESKTLSLTRWRESLERTLQDSQPRVLPDEQRAAIVRQYDEQILARLEEKEKAQSEYTRAVEAQRAQEAQELAAAAAMETGARQSLGTLEEHKREIEEHLGQYEQITFRRMLRTALSADREGWQQRLLSGLILFGFVAFGALNGVLLIVTLIRSLG